MQQTAHQLPSVLPVGDHGFAVDIHFSGSLLGVAGKACRHSLTHRAAVSPDVEERVVLPIAAASGHVEVRLACAGYFALGAVHQKAVHVQQDEHLRRGEERESIHTQSTRKRNAFASRVGPNPSCQPSQKDYLGRGMLLGVMRQRHAHGCVGSVVPSALAGFLRAPRTAPYF